MPPSPGGSTSSESVDGLLGDVGSPGRRVAAWARRDAVQAARAAAASVSSPSETTNDDQDVELLRLRLQVATDQLVRAPPRLPPPAAGCRKAGVRALVPRLLHSSRWPTTDQPQAEQQGCVRGLEAELRELRGRLGAAEGAALCQVRSRLMWLLQQRRPGCRCCLVLPAMLGLQLP